MKFRIAILSVAMALGIQSAHAEDVVHLGNLKFAHYGAVSYMKEIAPEFGLKVEERIFAKGLDIMPAILAGEIDVAASALDAAIAGRSGGAPIYVVAGFAKGGVRIVVSKKSGIHSVAEFKGKKIGVARGGAQELLLLAELAKAGLTWSDKPGKDVQIYYLAFADLNQALIGGQIDAICQSEPQAAQVINKGAGVEILKPYDTEMGEPIRALVMTEKMYKERPDVAKRFMKLFVKATQTFKNDPALAEKYVRTSLFKGQLSEQDYKDAMSNASFSYDIDLHHVQVTTDMMQKFGVGRMAAPPKATDWTKLDLLKAAKADLKIN